MKTTTEISTGHQPYQFHTPITVPPGWIRERDQQHYRDYVRFPGSNAAENWLERLAAVECIREDLDTLLAAALTFVFPQMDAELDSGPVPLPPAAKIALLRQATNDTDHDWVRKQLDWVAWALDESDRLVRQHLQKPGSVWLYEFCKLTDLLSYAGEQLHQALTSQLPGFREHAPTLGHEMRWWSDEEPC